MAELLAGLEDARAGRGRLFLVTGEPGIGKTRLADQVAVHAAGSGMAVLRVGCWEGAGAPAYWPFIQLIRAALSVLDPDAQLQPSGSAKARRMGQDLAQLLLELLPSAAGPADVSVQPPLEPEQARFRLFDAVATVIRDLASLKPLMLVFEDLHDADQPSLLMLRFVARQLKDAPLLVLCTYRNVEVQRSSTLSQLIGDLMREGAHTPLFAMSREDAARMIEERAGAPSSPRFVSDIYHATGGNPLFIDGLVRVLAAEGKLRGVKRLNLAAFKVPDGMREAIRRGLALVSDRSALVCAAIIGPQFDLSCLQRVTQVPSPQLVDMLSQAAAVGVVTPLSDRTYAFSHALIRNALSDELNATQRAQLHLKVGEAIEKLYQSDAEAHLGELAHHFRQAGNLSKAIHYSIRAGQAARAVFAYEEALTHWQAALELLPERREDLELRAKLLERTAELLGLTAPEEEGLFKYLRQALKVYQELGHTEAAARVQARMDGWLILHGRESDVSGTLENDPKKTSSAPQIAAESISAWRLHIGAATDAAAGRTEQALAGSRLTMEMSEQQGDQQLWAHASIMHASALFASGRVAESLALISRAFPVADRLKDVVPGQGLIRLLSHILSRLCDATGAVAQLERELAQPRMAEAALLRGSLIDHLRLHLVLRGRLREAGELHARAGKEPFFEGQIAFYQGEWEKADAVLADSLNQARQAGRPLRAAACGHWLAKVCGALRWHSAAEALLQEHLDICIEGPDLPLELHIRQELAQVCAQTGRPQQAHSHLARFREIVAGGEDWRGLMGQLARAEAVVAAAEGRFEDAQPLFGKAVEIHRRYHVVFEEAETLHHWGCALLAAGDHVAAVEKLDAAMELYRRHEAGERWLEAVQADRLRAHSAGAIAVRATPTRELPRPGTESKRGEDSMLTGVFRKQGEYWSLCWTGSESRLKERKGFHYIACLLLYPEQEVAAQDLVARVEPGGLADAAGTGEPHHGHLTITGGLGDAGEALDEKAKVQYKRRLKDLREELELAERCNDIGRAEKARAEIEFIEDQVAATVGLRGRGRRSLSHSERARLAVTKTIKAALSRIRQTDPELGRHLTLSIRTGNFCAYLPKQPVAWQL